METIQSGYFNKCKYLGVYFKENLKEFEDPESLNKEFRYILSFANKK